jgi:hypothetical protein
MWLDYDRSTWPPVKWKEHPEWQFELIRSCITICEAPKLIFIHLGRTGGHSISRKILETKFGGINSPNMDKPINDEKWKNYFKFTFVRNPWDKVVSAYNLPQTWFNRRPNHRLNGKIANNVDFDFFLKHILWDENGDACNHHWVEQYKFVQDFRSLINEMNTWVDFIGKFENLEEDWGKISKILGINEKLPHSNKNPSKNKKHYTKYYNDETVAIVADRAKKDIELFKYEFPK